jgi:hypothetical protein
MFKEKPFDIYDDLNGLKIHLDCMTKGMTKASKFYDIMYLIKLARPFVPMHVFKNVSNFLWKHISYIEKDTNATIRGLVMSKRKKDLQEKQIMDANSQKIHPNAPWILSKGDLEFGEEGDLYN